jgi:putative transposase
MQVERTGYYAWLHRKDAAEQKERHLKNRIREEFEKSNKTYGPDRISKMLRRTGDSIGYYKCAGYMADMGLSSIHNRRKTRSLTNSKKARGDGYPNLMRKECPIMPRYALASDITYLRTDEGFEYLCTVRDIVTGEVLGSSQSDRMTKELVMNALLSVVSRYGNELVKDFIFHSDRGSQYTSKAFMELVKMSGGRQSFSRVGMPGDNAWSESFFATMKKECIHWSHFRTRAELREVVFEYIYSFYNGERIQKRLGYMSPREYRKSLEPLKIKPLLKKLRKVA